MSSEALPDCDSMLLGARVGEEPWIAIAVVDIFSCLSTRRRMHIQNDVEILLLRPLNDTVKQSKSFGIVGLKKLVVQRDSYRVKAALLDEMDIRLGDVVFAIAAPEVMRSLRPDELSDKGFNIARRFGPPLFKCHI